MNSQFADRVFHCQQVDCCLHLQDEGEAAGGLVRVDQADYVGVLEPLEQVELLSHVVPPHQLLVDVLDGHRALGAALVAALDDGEATPGGRRHGAFFSKLFLIITHTWLMVSYILSKRRPCYLPSSATSM